MQTRKVNPLIKSLNRAIDDGKRQARDHYQTVKAASRKRLEWRAKYAEIFKGLDDYTLNVSLTERGFTAYVFLNDLESFKDERLTSLLSALYEHTDRIEETEYAAVFNKDYVAELDEMTVRIAAYVKSDSANCYRVEVGTEMREVTKYKMVCN